MKSQWKILPASLLCCYMITVPVSAADNPVVAKVNGREIRESEVENHLRGRNMPAESPAQREQAINGLVTRELVYQDALKRKLDKRADVMAELEQARINILANAAVHETMQAAPITEDEMKQEYQKQLPMMQSKEYKASHILLESEADAKAVIAALDKGADFAKLAKEKSIDPGKDNGGDLGWFSADQMVAPFSAAVSDMKKGSTSKAPVQSQFGWHVIRLEDVRDAKAPEYAEVKDNLNNYLQQRRMQAYFEKLRATAKVDIIKP